MIKVSIPGKIHLIGEHSSVYGKGAILASINLYLHAKISKSEEKEISGLVQYDDAIKNMQSVIETKIREKFEIKKIPNYALEIDKTGIPIGSGLGTSASLSVAFTICLLKYLEVKYTQDDVFEIALEGERIFLGNPSGGDLAAVLNQGLTYFKKNPDGPNTAAPLSINQDLNFLLIDSGKSEEGTLEMVEKVRIKNQELRIAVKKIIDDQEKLTNELLQVLTNFDKNKLKKIITKAENNLEKLGVVGKTAKAIIRKIEELQGAAKISGAGGIKKGSGMILAFHRDINELIKFAKKERLQYYLIQIDKTS